MILFIFSLAFRPSIFPVMVKSVGETSLYPIWSRLSTDNWGSDQLFTFKATMIDGHYPDFLISESLGVQLPLMCPGWKRSTAGHLRLAIPGSSPSSRELLRALSPWTWRSRDGGDSTIILQHILTIDHGFFTLATPEELSYKGPVYFLSWWLPTKKAPLLPSVFVGTPAWSVGVELQDYAAWPAASYAQG